jgi:MYXO-CTERM domain-containing protein
MIVCGVHCCSDWQLLLELYRITLALQHFLKVEIGGDGQSTDGAPCISQHQSIGQSYWMLLLLLLLLLQARRRRTSTRWGRDPCTRAVTSAWRQ